MASTLPSSNYKLYPNETFIAPQEFASQSSHANNNNMHYGLSMFLGEEDCYSSLFNNFDNLSLLSGCTNNIDDCYSFDFNSSMMMMEAPSFGNSGLDYCNSQIKGHSTTNSSGSTTCDEFESNAYSTLWKDYAPSANNHVATTLECWGFQGHTTQACGTDNTSHNNNNNNAKVGKYSAEERKDRILRYLKKRNQRNFRKTIKYACRKTLADRRVRVRGRFAKNQDDQESPTNYNYQTNQQDSVELRYNTADHKIEQYSDSNEEWLQETMSSLLYAPYISGWHRESHDYQAILRN